MLLDDQECEVMDESRPFLILQIGFRGGRGFRTLLSFAMQLGQEIPPQSVGWNAATTVSAKKNAPSRRRGGFSFDQQYHYADSRSFPLLYGSVGTGRPCISYQRR